MARYEEVSERAANAPAQKPLTGGPYLAEANSSMTGALEIKTGGALDLLSLGAMVIRLDPGVVPFSKASEAAISVSGAEYNVAANLASCFRMRTAVATAIVDNPIGDLVDERIRMMGVQPIYRRFATDRVRGPNIATVYSDRGYGVRAPVVFYNRADEAAARLAPGDFPWPAIFGDGVRWFHSGGLFTALSASTAELIVEGMRAARATGAVVSFDLNYRAKMWAASGGQSQAQETMNRIVDEVDVLVGNEEDLQAGLGIPGPTARSGPANDTSAFTGMIEQVVRHHPNVKVVATTLREVHSTNRHSWSAVVWADGHSCVAPTIELDVYDRVGGGDGFASGLFYGLLSGAPMEEALRLGWAHGALLTTYPGDTTMAGLGQVRALAGGQSARIQR
jgi:2-dehydro-3-deoxygluconokinase